MCKHFLEILHPRNRKDGCQHVHITATRLLPLPVGGGGGGGRGGREDGREEEVEEQEEVEDGQDHIKISKWAETSKQNEARSLGMMSKLSKVAETFFNF